MRIIRHKPAEIGTQIDNASSGVLWVWDCVEMGAEFEIEARHARPVVRMDAAGKLYASSR